jgi:hypothetical protein
MIKDQGGTHSQLNIPTTPLIQINVSFQQADRTIFGRGAHTGARSLRKLSMAVDAAASVQNAGN